MTESSLSSELASPETKIQFAGLSYEKALTVANQYLADDPITVYLSTYLQNDRAIAAVAEEMGIDEAAAGILIEKLEIKIAEAHLANVPRGYGHAANLLLIQGGKSSV